MYEERPARLPHVTAWRSDWRSAGAGGDARILPDGCLDIIWQDGFVFVAGPDTTAQLTGHPAGSRFAALRFAAGTGPAVLGVPADELTDRQVPLADLWPAVQVRPLAEAGDPLRALEAMAGRRWQPPDRGMVAVAEAARAGTPVEVIAGACGLSPRQLLRRSRAAFGYGPKVLARVMRLQRAVGLGGTRRTLADVAAAAGYADQAHLSREVRALAGVSASTLLKRS